MRRWLLASAALLPVSAYAQSAPDWLSKAQFPGITSVSTNDLIAEFKIKADLSTVGGALAAATQAQTAAQQASASAAAAQTAAATALPVTGDASAVTIKATGSNVARTAAVISAAQLADATAITAEQQTLAQIQTTLSGHTASISTLSTGLTAAQQTIGTHTGQIASLQTTANGAVQAASGNGSAVILGGGKTGAQVQAAQLADEATLAAQGAQLTAATTKATAALPAASAGPLATAPGATGTAALTTILGFTPYSAANPAGYVNAASAASAAPVQAVAGLTGAPTAAQIAATQSGQSYGGVILGGGKTAAQVQAAQASDETTLATHTGQIAALTTTANGAVQKAGGDASATVLGNGRTGAQVQSAQAADEVTLGQHTTQIAANTSAVGTAQTTANSALTAASAAQTTANTAASTASAAQTTAGNAIQSAGGNAAAALAGSGQTIGQLASEANSDHATVATHTGQIASLTMTANSALPAASAGPLATQAGANGAAAVAAALGYTPYSAANPAGYVTSASVAATAPVQSIAGLTGAPTAAQLATAAAGQDYSAAVIGGGKTGTAIQASQAADEANIASITATANAALPKAGGTLTGSLTLPTLSLTGSQTAATVLAAPVGAAGAPSFRGLSAGDITGAAPLASPALTGVPTVPTAAAGTNTNQAASTAFVQSAVVAGQGAPINSPTFTGTVTVPTIAVTGSQAKSSVLAAPAGAAGAPGFRALGIADVTGAAPLVSPVFTGTVSAPYLALTGSQGASTVLAAPQGAAGAPAFRTLSLADVTGAAPVASPTFTGLPAVPTAAAGTNTTQAASTAFVGSAVGSEMSRANAAEAALAPLASPAFSGTPLVPTAPTGNRTAQVASTAFVGGEINNEASRAEGAEAAALSASNGAVESATTSPQTVASPLSFSRDAAGTRLSLWPQLSDPYSSPDEMMLGGLTAGTGGQMMVRGMPYGQYDSGTLMSLVTTNRDIYGSRAGVQNFDMVNLYDQVSNMPPRLIVSNGITYDATHIYFSTPLTNAQMALLHKSMWVITNSVDPGTANTAGTNNFPSFNVMSSTISQIDPAGASVTVNGWSAGGATSNSGAIPGTTYDTVRSQYATPTVFFGTPAKAFARNTVLAAYDPTTTPDVAGSMTNLFEGDEIDMFNYRNQDYTASFHGTTITYRPLGTVPASGNIAAHPPYPTADSYDLLLAGSMPNGLEFNLTPTSRYVVGESVLINGNGGIPASSPTGTQSAMTEFSKYSGGNNLRFMTWLQSSDANVQSWQDSELHLGLFVDGAQGSNQGSAEGDVVFDPAGHLGGVSIRGYGAYPGLIVEGNGTLTLPSAVTTKSTLAVGGDLSMSTPSGATGSYIATDNSGTFYVGTGVAGGTAVLALPTKLTGGATVTNGLTADALSVTGEFATGSNISTGFGSSLILRTPAGGIGGTLSSDAAGDVFFGTGVGTGAQTISSLPVTAQSGLSVTGGLTADAITATGGIAAASNITTGDGAALILRTPSGGAGGTLNSDAAGDAVFGTQVPGGSVVATNPVIAQNGLTVTSGNLSAPVLATGSTTARNVSTRAADVSNVLDSGAKCDGATDDAAAFVRAETLAASKTNGGKVYVPAGVCYLASSPAITVAAGKSIAFIGDGADATMLKFATGINGLAITMGAGSGASVIGMTIDRTGSTVAGNTGLSITETGANSGSVVVRDVDTQSDSYPGSWLQGIVLTSTDNAVVDHVYTIAGFPPENSDGLLIQGLSGIYAIDTKITNSKFQGGNIGLHASGYVQGVEASDIYSIAGNYGVSWTDGLANPQYVAELLEITNSHLNAIKEDAQVAGVSLTLSDNLLWRWPDGSGDSTSWTGVDLNGAGSSIVHHNNVNGGNGGTFTGSEYFVHLTNSASTVESGNTILTINGPYVQIDGASSVSNSITDNVVNGAGDLVDNSGGYNHAEGNSVSGVTAVNYVAGKLLLQAPTDKSVVTTATLSSGQAANSPNNGNGAILACSGTLAALTWNFPTNPIQGERSHITSECSITALTLQPQPTTAGITVSGAPAGMTPSTPLAFVYDATNKIWARW